MTVRLTSGRAYVVYRLGAISQGCVGLYVYPDDGKPLTPYPSTAKEGNPPRFMADLVTVSYESILEVRLDVNALGREVQKVQIGFHGR